MACGADAFFCLGCVVPAGGCSVSKALADTFWIFVLAQMPSKFVEIVPPFHRQGNCIPSAAFR